MPALFDTSSISPRGWEARRKLWTRQERSHGGVNKTGIISAGIVLAIVLMIIAFLSARSLRARYLNPKYIPTPFLKNAWKCWKVGSKKTAYYHQTRRDYRSASHMREAQDNFEEALADVNSQQCTVNHQTQAGIDRKTSVRSVITLPAYRQKATETEQVLGREGERNGIDVVLEMPTAEDEEAMRDDEMEALYQIRVARRRQMADREEGRNARRLARDQRDYVALEDLRMQARIANELDREEVDNLRLEHERRKEQRQRAVSSVSYADLGVARADGTRLRANSMESEGVGLLSDAASIARSAHSTNQSHSESILQRRERSHSCAMTIDTRRSTERSTFPALAINDSISLQTEPRAQTHANSDAISVPSRAASPVGSSSEIIDLEGGDLGNSRMPPPGYDDVSLNDITPPHSRDTRSSQNSPYSGLPPNYPGPAQARHNRLSAHIEELATTAAGKENDNNHRRRRASSNASAGPSLTRGDIPQIVIEPFGVRPQGQQSE